MVNENHATESGGLAGLGLRSPALVLVDDGCTGGDESQSRATLVDLPAESRVVRVSCGFNHSAAVTDDGTIWVWGKVGLGWRPHVAHLRSCELKLMSYTPHRTER